MHTFRNWDAALAYYTHQFSLHNVANACETVVRCSMPGPVTPEPDFPAQAVALDLTRGVQRAQSAPPSLSVAIDGVDARTPSSMAPPPGNGASNAIPVRALPRAPTPPVESGSPAHPFYVPSSWPTPIIATKIAASRGPTTRAASQREPPMTPASSRPQLPTIFEATERPPLTQLHFDRTGRLIHPTAISVPSSPEDNEIQAPPAMIQAPPTRKPQPFPFVPDPNFFTYPSPVPPGTCTPNNDYVPSARQLTALALTLSGEEGVPDSPFLNTPSQRKRFVNLFPSDADSPATNNNTKNACLGPASDSDDLEDWAKAMFQGCSPSQSASTAKRRTPAASSSKASNVSKKRRSPAAPTLSNSKPTKARKTTTKKSGAMSAPVPDIGYTSDSMYLDD